jgi:hypothetical protein
MLGDPAPWLVVLGTTMAWSWLYLPIWLGVPHVWL